MDKSKNLNARTKLLSSTLDQEKQALFLNTYAAHKDDWNGMQEKLLKEGLAPEEVQKLELVYHLADITGDNATLVSSLQKKLTSVREMALTHDRKKIQSLLKAATIPEETPGGTTEEKLEQYARYIEKQLYHKEPSAVITRMVKNDGLPIKDKDIQKGVLSFLEQHPDFNIRKTSVYTAVKQQAAGLSKIDPLQRTEVMDTLKNIQRITSLSDSPDLVPKMMEANLTSAHKIVAQPQTTFVRTYAEQLGGEEAATQVYEQAANITTRNEFLLTALRDKVTGASIAAIDGKKGKEEAIATLQEMAEQNNLVLNWEALFGNADMCECDECRSVYSASAYLVELLQYLRDDGNDVSPLRVLLKRRPDIGNLELTCENANTILPYVDIVNEIMESFVENLPTYQAGGNVKLDVYNVTDETSEELLAIPQHINYKAYKILNNAVYPSTLPYNQPLDAIRLLLQKLGTTRHDMMDAFDMSKPPNDDLAMNNARFAELLQISREEFITLTKEDFYRKEYYESKAGKLLTIDEYRNLIGVKPVWQYYGVSTEAELISELKMVKNRFLPGTGISLKDLVAILETKSVNTARPQGAALAMMRRIPYGYRYLQSLVVNATDPAVKYAQVISLLENAFQTPADKTAVRNWVLQHFEKVGKMIVLELGGVTHENIHYYGYYGHEVDLWQVVNSSDISNATLQHLDGTPLTVAEYDTLQRFIRLWRKLNWSIGQTDMAIIGLSPSNSTGYEITVSIIKYLSWLKRLITHTGLPVERLLVCWADMQTHGEKSLYQQLFLTPNILAIDRVFAPDVNGNYLAESLTITGHMAGIMAALQLTADEIKLILSSTAMPDVLSLKNVSVLFRYGLLARYLKLPVKRLLELKNLFGDPFTNSNTTYDFILLCEDIQASKFRPELLNYMIANIAEPGFVPSEKSILTIAKSLHDELRNKEAQYVEQPEVTAEMLQKQLLLVFKDAVVNNIMAFLNGAAVFTVKVEPRLPILFPDTVAGRFTYDIMQGILSVKGMLSEEQWNEVINMARDERVKSALRNLAAQPGIFIDDTMFAFIPANSSARKIILAGGPETTVDGKITVCYNQFMPFLKKQQVKQLIIEKLSSALQTDPAITEWLLTTLLMNTLGAKPLITDFEKVGQPAITGPIWNGYLTPATDDVYTFVMTGSQPSLWLDEQLIALQTVEGNPGQYQTAPQQLKAGQLYKLKIIGLNGDLSRLFWKTPTVPRLQVPDSCLFPAVINEAFAAAYRKLHKATLFINGFALTAEELKQLYICKDAFAHINLNSITLPLWRRFREYTIVRNRHKNGSISLAAFLAWARNPVNVTLAEKIAALTGWDLDRVKQLISPAQFNYIPGNFQNERNLDKMYKSLSLSEQTGIETGRLISWAVPILDFDNCCKIAENIRSAMRARYTQEDWHQVIKPVNDQLRTNQRNALISYLLVQPALQEWATSRNIVLDAETLFEFFLIDVQMESVMETSRIRQAISSVQTFVQRCFMGLEKDISTDLLDRNRWDWMQQYRTWEANRKVFLYPENWIEPDLRDSKSPFFRELEAELLQQDITPENLEKAIRNYLHKLDEIGSLDICAVYQEWEPYWPQHGVMKKLPTVSHIIGRTRNVPYIYYYRKFYHEKRIWTPWEKIETDIQLVEEDSNANATGLNGNYLVPVVWKNRLLLFWPVFTKKTAGRKSGGQPLSGMTPTQLAGLPCDSIKPLEYWEIKLAWSECKEGKWTAKQTSACFVRSFASETTPSVSRFFFSQDPQPEQLQIYVHEQHAASDYLSRLGTFVFRDSNNISAPVISDDWWYSIHQHFARNTKANFMHFYPLTADVVDITSSDGSNAGNAGLIFNKSLTDYKLVRTLQKDFHNYYENYEVSFVYQEDHSDDSHNRTMVGYLNLIYNKYDVENFYHPYTRTFLQELDQNGLPGLLKTLTQQSQQYATTKEAYEAVNINQWPDGGVDFGKEYYHSFIESRGTYSIYNWELFFHIPLLIADRLSKSRQYEQARNWFHYIFNPLAEGPEHDVKRYWQFLPFKTSQVDSITSILYFVNQGSYDSDVAAWRNDPFNPHLIARSRPAAYMKTVVMKYLDNLIAWGDELYRQNTMETINQAVMLYVIAGHILGPRPRVVPPRGSVRVHTYNSLKSEWDAFGNALVEMELAFPYSGQVMHNSGNQNGKPYRGNNIFGFGASFYFGIPNNPQLLKYWDTVADRLFKIRHSMNIDGIVQKLALYEPPIDPALLVQAAANGISLSSVLNDFNVSMPFYRFHHLTAKALELCADVKALGSQLVSVIERRDAEALSRLRSTHEVNLLNAVKGVKTTQLEEARSQLEILNKTRENTGKRLKHFQQLLGITAEVPVEDANYRDINGMFPARFIGNSGLKLIDLEMEDMIKARQASELQTISGIMETAASVASMLPSISVDAKPLGVGGSISMGGSNVGAYFSAIARGIQTRSNRLQFESGAAAKKAGFLRQRQDWILQANSTGNELMQIDKQIIAAKIRIAIAEKELQNHYTQIEQAREMQDYLAAKYTNQELYQWMEGQVRTIYRQAYQLAYDMARKAEKAWRFERGETNTDFIKLAYWNGQRDGLLAGEQLSLAIRQMERAYQDKNKRDYEITKHISLAQWDPVALIDLKEKGHCDLLLPEEMFDLDFPGHYMRRIKSMGVSIPCVAGPYTSISATLTLLQDKTRVSSITGSQYAEDTTATDERFVTNFVQLQSIATSQAQHDNGMFELNFRDERYLPFEGAGAVSRWRLELPDAFRQFDYDTIPDVIFHLQYTAREGGAMLKQAAVEHLNDYMENASGEEGLVRLFSLRHEFATEWHRFLHPVNGNPVLSLTALGNRLPFFTRSKNVQNIKVTGVELLMRGTVNSMLLNNKPMSGGESGYDGISQFTLTSDCPGLAYPWQFTSGDSLSTENAAIQDAWLIIRYSLEVKLTL
jgi:hypothetical protein